MRIELVHWRVTGEDTSEPCPMRYADGTSAVFLDTMATGDEFGLQVSFGRVFDSIDEVPESFVEMAQRACDEYRAKHATRIEDIDWSWA